MTDLEFQDRAEDLLRVVETTCDRINDTTDADIDTSLSEICELITALPVV